MILSNQGVITSLASHKDIMVNSINMFCSYDLSATKMALNLWLKFVEKCDIEISNKLIRENSHLLCFVLKSLNYFDRNIAIINLALDLFELIFNQSSYLSIGNQDSSYVLFKNLIINDSGNKEIIER